MVENIKQKSNSFKQMHAAEVRPQRELAHKLMPTIPPFHHASQCWRNSKAKEDEPLMPSVKYTLMGLESNALCNVLVTEDIVAKTRRVED